MYSEYANLLRYAGSYQKSINAYKQAIAINPNDSSLYLDKSSVYLMRGATYIESNQYKKALADYDRVLEILTENKTVKTDTVQSVKFKVMAYRKRGFAYLKLKQYEKALVDYSEVLKVNPNDSNSYFNRGVVYQELKQYENALADYSKVIQALNSDRLSKTNFEIDRSIRAYLFRGGIYGRSKQYQKALADFNKAIEINPKDKYSYFARGDIFATLNQYDKAIADYSKAIELNLKNPDIYISRAIIYQKQQKLDLALADYKSVLKIKSNSLLAITNVGLIQYEMGAIAEAKRQFYQGLTENNKSAEIQLAIAVTEYFQGNIQTALKLAQTALKSDSRLGNPEFLREQLWGEKMIADTQKLLTQL